MNFPSAVARTTLGLNADSRILFFGSESATDPVLYAQLVGESAASVAARAADQATTAATRGTA